MKQPRTIGIIGGKGRMGKAFVRLFESLGYELLVADRRTKLSNRELVKRADVIIVSVPIDRTAAVIEEITPLIKKTSLLMDVTSVKQMPVDSMLRSKASVIGLHPMCNETTFGPGQTLIYCPARPGKWLKWLHEVFEAKAGLHMVKLTAKQHDETMAFVQGLIHFSEIALGKTLSQLDPNLQKLLQLASPASQLQLKIAARHLAQDPNLYGNIQIQNLSNAKVIQSYQSAVNELADIVTEKRDLKAFTRFFNDGGNFFGDFGETAMRETDGMIYRMLGEPTAPAPSDRPKEAIGCLGPDLTFSALAAKRWQKEEQKMSKRKTPRPVSFFERIDSVVEAVAKGRIHHGVVPVENRLQGTVRETLDQLFLKKVTILGEFNLPIKHHLVTINSRTKKLNIKRIMSHPQALGQCSKFLKKNYPNARWISTTSTAAALNDLAKHQDEDLAVIGSEEAAKALHLKILSANIANEPENSTRFLVLGKASAGDLPTSLRRRNQVNNVNPRGKLSKSSWVFYFNKNQPGSLFKVLEIFAEHGINLSRIESRPAPRKFGEYLFYIDLDGDPSTLDHQKAIRDFRKVISGGKCLGEY